MSPRRLPARSALLGRHPAARPRGGDDVLRRAVRLGVRGPGARWAIPWRAARPRRRRDRLAARRPASPAWTTYVYVESADETARERRARAAPSWSRPSTRSGRPPGRPRRPGGAVFGVWEPRERKGAQLVNEPSAWAMSQLRTPDPDGAVAFYGAVFGWKTRDLRRGRGRVRHVPPAGLRRRRARAARAARRRRDHAAAGRGRRGRSPLERRLLGRQHRYRGGQGHRARGQGGGPASRSCRTRGCGRRWSSIRRARRCR